MRESFETINNIDFVELDIHGYTKYETQTDLPRIMVEYFESGYTHFNIVHGFRSGNILQIYVRTKLKHDILRIKSCKEIKVLPKNDGDTIFAISGDLK
ncbi:MAG: hypothetical protein HeimC2_10990 [Candidatus Heimdallarchaeota archaeon LC_2]|nr:MAG: hypothetical protein HeimC2_10990 [Candidatus Heimdallarchaeota archaeon LC_2]